MVVMTRWCMAWWRRFEVAADEGGAADAGCDEKRQYEVASGWGDDVVSWMWWWRGVGCRDSGGGRGGVRMMMTTVWRRRRW
ncbi:hypothetical protein Tco_0780119 [Tanacetum coccineum]